MFQLTDVLKNRNLMVSMSEGRRVVCMGGIKVNGETITDISATVESGDRIQIGKRIDFIVDLTPVGQERVEK